MLRKLLVPLDGSELAEAVLPWALFLAREKRLSVTLARTVRMGAGRRDGPNGGGSASADAEPTDARWEAARAYLEEVQARLTGEGVETEVAVCEGPPAQTLLDLADEIDASAIALAARGQGGTHADPFGAVAEQIVQQATVPVLLVPTGGALVHLPSLRHLLVPLDGSPLAERALEVAAELADEDASVMLVRVVEPVQQTLDTAEGRLPLEDTEATARARAEAGAYLQTVRQSLGSGRFAIRTSVPLGDPDRQIIATAHEHGTDMVVMVTHGTTGSGRGWLGSVANDVIRRSDIPVFLVSARALVARVGRGQRVVDVMTRNPVCVRVDESLDVVLRRLLRHRISGAPVVDLDGTLAGVISEHDLLHWQAAQVTAPAGEAGTGPAATTHPLRTTRAGEVMSHLTVSIEESVPLASAVSMLLELPYRRLPVTRHGRLVGILARADILRAMAEYEAEAISGLFGETVAPEAPATEPVGVS